MTSDILYAQMAAPRRLFLHDDNYVQINTITEKNTINK